MAQRRYLRGNLLTPHELITNYIDYICSHQRPPSDKELSEVIGCNVTKVRLSMIAASEAGYLELTGGCGTRRCIIKGLRLVPAVVPQLSEMPL